MSLHGHRWTIVPRLGAERRLGPERGAPWSTTLSDPVVGIVQLTGFLQAPRGSGTLVVLVHGLGGSPASIYLRQAAHEFEARGFDTLRPALRGADRSGADIYHAGLSDDLSAVLASDALAAYDDIWVIGFSMGGHMSLTWAVNPTDDRVRGVAAVCPPLDLARGAEWMDGRARFVYRQYVLTGLKEIRTPTALHRELPDETRRRIERIRGIRRWDADVIAPRFGFLSVEEYYDREAVGPKLKDVKTETLIVQARQDPMVPEHCVRPSMERAGDAVRSVWAERGGHVAFPENVDWGLGRDPGVVGQLTGWFEGL